MVWRDAARHRGDPLTRIGPSTKALPYLPAYLKLIQSSEPYELPWIDMKALPGPSGDLAPAAVHAAALSRALAENPSIHVLPMPLIDVIMAVSRLRVSRGEWYPSAIRKGWAEQRMGEAKSALVHGKLVDAATALAEVFGTMLPSFWSEAADKSERGIGEQAWQALGQLVDQSVFVGLLYQAFAGVSPDDNQITFSSLSRHAGGFKAIGPGELQAAEEIQRIDEEIVAAEASPREPITTTLDRWDIPERLWAVPHGTLRLCGEPFLVTMSYGDDGPSMRPAYWGYDADDRLLLFAPDGIIDDMRAAAGPLIGDREWVVVPRVSIRTGARCPHCRLMARGLLMGGTASLTGEHAKRVEAVNEEVRGPAEKRQRERAEATIIELKKRHRKLVSAYLKQYREEEA